MQTFRIKLLEMIKYKFFFSVILLGFFLIFTDAKTHLNDDVCVSQSVIKHSGGTDKCGCHVNRKTGEYHCHTRKQRGGDCPP